MRLHSKIIGKGPVIVVLHGLFGMSDNWLTVAKNLSNQFCFYLLDLRNHGRSEHSIDFNFELMAEDVIAFCEDQNLTDISLLGHSMGGKTAICVAVKKPHILKNLIIVDMANKNYNSSIFRKYIEIMLSMDLPELKSRKDAEEIFREKHLANPAVMQFLLKNLYRDEKNHFKWRLNLPSLRDNIDNILMKIEIENPILLNTLFMKGSESDYITEEDEREIKEQFINARVVTIEGANHWMHSSAPSNFMHALTTFLQ